MQIAVQDRPVISEKELQDKHHWLCKFRRAKTRETLATMVAGAMRKNPNGTAILAAIVLAECQRTRELETGVLLNK